MNKFLTLSLIAAIPAFMGEINQAFAQPQHAASPLASESTTQKVTPQQAAKTTHDTNRRIARGPQRRPDPSAED